MTRKRKITVVHSLRDKRLFGALPVFKDLTSWSAWIVWLKSVFALPMDADEIAIFRECTGRSVPPKEEPQEVFTIVGRRGGKSFIAALTAVFCACFVDYSKYLVAGESAAVLVLARDKDQARIVFKFIAA